MGAHGESPLAWDCLAGISNGDDAEGDHPILSLDGVLELLDLLGIFGVSLARLYARAGFDPEVVRLVVFAVSEGHLPIHKLRDAALGLPVDLEVPRVREIVVDPAQ